MWVVTQNIWLFSCISYWKQRLYFAAGLRQFCGYSIGQIVPLLFKSYQPRRVTRSVLEAELIVFSDMIDASFTLRNDLKHLYSNGTVPMQLLTDSKSLLDTISKGSRTSEKQLMLDNLCARESLRKMEISDIRFICSADNIADGLTQTSDAGKIAGCLDTGRLDIVVKQWIVRIWYSLAQLWGRLKQWLPALASGSANGISLLITQIEGSVDTTRYAYFTSITIYFVSLALWFRSLHVYVVYLRN